MKVNWSVKQIAPWLMGSHVTAETFKQNGIDDALTRTVGIIDNTLQLLIYSDAAVEACRNHRTGTAALKKLRRSFAGLPAQQIMICDCLFDSAERIAEISRRILTTPGAGLTLSQRCDLDVIRKDVVALAGCTHLQFSLNRDFLLFTISSHIERMEEKDWDDSSRSYMYLKLLHNLQSVLECRNHFAFQS